MKDKTDFLNLVTGISKKHELEYLKTLNTLKSDKLEVIVSGLPKSGKTTFLNALLGLSRNELYESTKKATKCIFKISYGEKYCYKRNNEEIKPMPETLEARRDLILYLNNTDNFAEIILPVDILKLINIYDVPGLFSGDTTDNYFDYLTKSFDLFLLLKNIDDICTPEELNFINLSRLSGANCLILFSFGDMLDKGIKNNAAEFQKYFANKILEYPDSPDYFLISSEDYYRNNEKGNIKNVATYIKDNSEKFKTTSINEKILISSKEYREMLDNKLSEAQKNIKNKKEKLNDLYKIKISREKLKKDDELNDFKLSLSEYSDQMMFEFRKKLNSNDKSKNDLEKIWNNFFELSILLAQRNIKKDFITNIPEIPEYDEIILSKYDLESIILKLKDITNSEEKDDNIDSLHKQIKELLEQTKNPGTKKSTEDEFDKNVETILDKFKDFLKKIDYDNVLEEINKYVKYRDVVTSFLNNCLTLYNSSNEGFIELFEKEIMEELLVIEQQKNKDTFNLKKKMNDELNIDEIKDDIIKLQDYYNES